MAAWPPPVCALAGALLLAGAAAAETVRLRSGAVYEAESVEVRGETLVLRMRIGAGSGSASFPMERVVPEDLLRILTPLTAPDDPVGQMRLSRTALEAGRFGEAAERAGRAAALDPALGPGEAEVHVGIRGAQADAALAEILSDLRAGRPIAARERARTLLEAGIPVVPPEGQAQRARLLLGLAEGVIEQAALPPPLVPGPPAPVPALPEPPAAALADADQLTARGLAAREQAADPALPPPAREARLLSAGADLLHARRLLQALAPDAAVVARLDRLRAWLVATWLDLGDLARGAGQPLIALDRVQAALVLDPENERAWELRRWVEGDLMGPPIVVQEPAVWFSPGFLSPSPFFAGGGCCPGPYAGGFVAHGHAHVGHHGSSGGAHHNAGRRR